MTTATQPAEMPPDQYEAFFCTSCGAGYQFLRRRGRLQISKRLRCRGCRRYLHTCNWQALSPKVPAAPGPPPDDPAQERAGLATDEPEQMELFGGL